MIIYDAGYYTIDDDGIDSLVYFLKQKALGKTIYIISADEKIDIEGLC